jgi:hypothetical protein
VADPFVSLIVPLRPAHAKRDRNWAYLRGLYERFFPTWEIVVRDNDGPCWCKGAAINAAVEASKGDVLVVVDADVWLSPHALSLAVGVLPDWAWVVPHEQVWRMNEQTTDLFLSGAMGTEPQPLGATEIARLPRLSTEGGGAFVIQRDYWIRMDERFIEWGAEDISHGRLLDTLLGEHRTLSNSLWHLWHEPMPTRDGRRALREASEQLAGRYWSATSSKEEMQALVEESNAFAI